MTKITLSRLSDIELLSLMSASAVLRKYKLLNMTFVTLKERNIDLFKVYESLLQIYLFSGYPNALVAFKYASKYFQFEKIKSEKIIFRDLSKRGKHTSQKIYGKNLEKLISNVKILSPDLSEWFILEGYGKVLSRKNLSLKDRELQIISMLTSLRYEDQLLSHIIGALRNGATFLEVQKIILNLRILNSSRIVDFGLEVFNRYMQKSI
ncbi:MAG TPA: carboxymuconolactone decarboxylase family protein [Ignavibacteriaceae bacterium]|mgnify:CR=1 FL=1|nr:carboxymuconolactone decarboxylase family protein [Ignavibacteriaceae bacterium]